MAAGEFFLKSEDWLRASFVVVVGPAFGPGGRKFHKEENSQNLLIFKKTFKVTTINDSTRLLFTLLFRDD